MAVLVKKSGSESPGIMTINDSFTYASINLNIRKEKNIYYWDALELPKHAIHNIYCATGKLKHKILIVHIIRAFYDENDEIAILANYMMDPNNENYAKEYFNYQKLRILAKNIAIEIEDSKIFQME